MLDHVDHVCPREGAHPPPLARLGLPLPCDSVPSEASLIPLPCSAGLPGIVPAPFPCAWVGAGLQDREDQLTHHSWPWCAHAGSLDGREREREHGKRVKVVSVMIRHRRDTSGGPREQRCHWCRAVSRGTSGCLSLATIIGLSGPSRVGSRRFESNRVEGRPSVTGATKVQSTHYTTLVHLHRRCSPLCSLHHGLGCARWQ